MTPATVTAGRTALVVAAGLGGAAFAGLAPNATTAMTESATTRPIILFFTRCSLVRGTRPDLHPPTPLALRHAQIRRRSEPAVLAGRSATCGRTAANVVTPAGQSLDAC